MCITDKNFIYYNFSLRVVYLVLPGRRIVTSFSFHPHLFNIIHKKALNICLYKTKIDSQ